MRIRTHIALTAALAVAVTVSAASSASAAPQLLIREVSMGLTFHSDYVMLQMTADGQNTLAGNYIHLLDGSGTGWRGSAPERRQRTDPAHRADRKHRGGRR